MKPIQIEFIDNGRWIVAYAATAISCSLVLCAGAWRWKEDQRAIQVLDTQIAQTRRQAVEDRAKSSVPDPYRIEREKFEKLLQMDLNKVFDAAERIDQPGTRLRSMEFDAAANSLRFEYELGSIKDAVSITFALNAGYGIGPWQLESVSAVGAATQPGATPEKFRGLWLARADRL